MCLSFVHSEPMELTEGYKAFRKWKNDNHLYPLFGIDFGFKRLGWNHDHQNFRLESTYNGMYPTGFHVFRSLEDCRGWVNSMINYGKSTYVIHRVKVLNIRATGIQNDCCVAVCGSLEVKEECSK